ncbi:hypothetical protein RVF83_06915 [Gordonia rubripertincta]|uniref:Uncharacterized protein n=2 Tax=Gordonia rubripertincta TaxID=36822 RepID=A0AAW6R881_GORRU|nr:hypothetical protein [Gordonia rubripertincta]ASR01005.1 hypothetical protein GCWB2_00840 [Gordonia rubripertincta]MBM7280202.1 hypothetical protein [Gordonia rubripertincta]MDG6780706.1 hypothetical protein [Gordonia rubripertincta]NKY63146.1 hypothetical protein [Gordonia rubripertincta]QMU21932.1 hypothetical protein H3V45_05385 [Gordonia rubripertincta]
MAQYRVVDSDEKVIEEKDFDDATSAYDWFKTVAAPEDSLGTVMQVHDNGEWKNFEVSDGGTNTHPSADAE